MKAPIATLVAVLGLLSLTALAACGGNEPSTARDDIGFPRDPVGPGATVPGPGHATNDTIRLPRATSVPPGGTTIAPGAAPQIVTLDVPPSVDCDGRERITENVAYETRNADRVALVVDGRQVPDELSVSGQVDVILPCDDQTHVVLLTAASPDNQTVVDSRAVLTQS